MSDPGLIDDPSMIPEQKRPFARSSAVQSTLWLCKRTGAFRLLL